ncbi:MULTISPECIES: helix-turn-helix transcriptional regulator [Vibrio]|uniref:Transcriptional regulator n=1 Tax=Vibrio jasicida TaxID=766224 RepID=A0AAU9QYB1_9VIBR|nr:MULTISPECIES: helix-turn-helix transcriptional regulator [Vibrio]CAH1603278.1 Transcriptional regulator [Vibrio jasicida]CAH1603841.1 Transcriptional regulator [Vibrio jasicida]
MLFKKQTLTTLGSRVKMAIHARGKTPADIERETGVAKSYISRVINNKISNPKKFIKTISAHLLISERWLIEGTGSIDIDPDSTIKIYDVVEQEYDGALVVHERYENVMEGLQAWKGFDCSPYTKDSIIITTKKFDNVNGDYLIKKADKFYIALRVNDEYFARWFYRHDVKEVNNIREYKIIGMIVLNIISNNYKSIEFI